jgi:hypothetical protein
MSGVRASDVVSARRWAAALVLGATLSVFAAAVGLPSRGTAIGAPASRALAQPRELQVEGEFVHRAGFEMPVRVGPFERAGLTQYDEDGADVSAGYNAVVGETTHLPIVATLYVYPRRTGQELDASFDNLLADIGAHHGGARPEFRQNIILGRGFEGRYAGFGYAEPWAGLSRTSHCVRTSCSTPGRRGG